MCMFAVIVVMDMGMFSQELQIKETEGVCMLIHANKTHGVIMSPVMVDLQEEEPHIQIGRFNHDE